MSGRSIGTIEAELRDVERHLADAPPHSASGLRDELQARAARLRRELAEARAATRGQTGRQ